MSEEIINDPAGYRKLCEPFASIEDANAAIQAFNIEMRELRKKHRIQDVSCVMAVTMVVDGDEVGSLASAHHGDESREESMLAWGFGQAQERRSQHTLEMMAAGKRIRKPKGGK